MTDCGGDWLFLEGLRGFVTECAGARMRVTMAPRVIARAMHHKHPAHHHDRPLRPMRLNKRALHRGAREKMPTAFFKISRSIFSRSFSLRRDSNSAAREDASPTARFVLSGCLYLRTH